MSSPHAHPRAGDAGALSDDQLPLRWYVRLVRRLCPSGGRVLNFGCGDGSLLRRLSSQFEAFGYDAAPMARSRCRTNVPDAVILEAWESQPPASFDLIVSVRGMERLAQPLPNLLFVENRQVVERCDGHVRSVSDRNSRLVEFHIGFAFTLHDF